MLLLKVLRLQIFKMQSQLHNEFNILNLSECMMYNYSECMMYN